MYPFGLDTAGNAINLRRLIWLRFVVTGSEAAAILYALNSLHITLPLNRLVILLAVYFIISLLTLWRLQFARPVANYELFLHFTVDVIALTVFLYLTGGSTNPFAPLYLLPLTLTAASLPAIYSWNMVAVTLACYTGLLFYYVELPVMHGSHEHGFRLHVLGMWLGFLLSALLIAGFVVRMASTVRRQDKKITDLREQQMRHEQILSLGTLAAGAAHELGTPLSTMAIMLNDMEPEEGISRQEIDTLREQVDRCRNILGSLSATAGAIRAESGGGVMLDEHLAELVNDWQVSRTNINVKVDLSGSMSAPRIVIDQTLDQALLNIFNNAADASPDDIEIHAIWDTQTLILEVADRGSGLAPDVINTTGENIHSTKQHGLGLGLFLTYTTLERFGGNVQLVNREKGGVLCRVTLPLQNILIPD